MSGQKKKTGRMEMHIQPAQNQSYNWMSANQGTKHLKRIISAILVEFNENAPVSEISRFTMKIIKAIDQYGSPQKSTAQDQPSTSLLTSANEMADFIETTRTINTTSKQTITIKMNSTNERIVPPKLLLNRLVDGAKRDGKKISPEILRLMPSEGFVDQPPRRSKRVPKPIVRFSDMNFESPNRGPVTRNHRNGVMRRTIEKKVVRVQNTSMQKTVMVQKENISVAQPNTAASGELISVVI